MSKLLWYDGIRVDLTDVKDFRQDIVLILARRKQEHQVALQIPLEQAQELHATLFDAIEEAQRNSTVLEMAPPGLATH